MSWLDIRTVIASHLVGRLLCFLVLFSLWRQNGRRYPGLDRWWQGYALQLLGTALIMTRGSVPDLLSMTAANTLVIGGMIVVLAGLERFVGGTPPRLPALALLGAFAFGHAYFVFVKPSLPVRTILLAAVSIVICMYGAAIAWRPPRAGEMKISRVVGHVYAVLAAVSLLRIVGILVGTIPGNDFFEIGGFEAVILLAALMLFVLMAFSLALMVNRRLIGEAKLQEEKFTKAFRSTPYALIITRAEDGLILDVNEGFCEITGYAAAEAIGKTTLELRFWERDADRDRALSALAKRGRVREMEFRFRTRSGRMIDALYSAELISVDGRPHILSIVQDISLRKRAEEALRESEDKFKYIFDHSVVGKSITSPDRRIHVNKAFADMLGYTVEEMEGRDWREYTHPDDVELNSRALEGVLSGEKESARFVKRYLRKDGGVCWADVSTSLRRSASGEPLYFMTGVIDITERVKAEEERDRTLRQNELLMAELKHRVKNSLTVVSALVGMSGEDVSDPRLGAILADLRTRIGSISQAYEQLDRTGRADVIHLSDYILRLAESLATSYGPPDGHIRVTTRLEDIAMSTKKALPLGLVVNELIINAFKYAYPEGSSGEIRVILAAGAGRPTLTISDDGIGRPASGTPGREGTGLKMVEMLVEQIGARLDWPPGPGTTAVVSF